MSDGIAHIGPPRQVTRTIEGKEYTFSTIILADHAEKENYILSLMPGPMEALATVPSSVPKHVQEMLVAAAMKAAQRPRFVTRDEEQEFDESLHGNAWRIWRSLRDNHVEFGKPTEGRQNKYTIGKKSYTLTPAEGVQAALDFMERIGNEALMKQVIPAVDGSEQADLLPN
jgi:TRAP-type C4-dicarboxylate transport system substrate-binding protein